MSRALVALDALRDLTDGTPADLAALLSEVVAECPIAGPWREVRIGLLPSWSREVIVRTARGDQFPGLVEATPDGGWCFVALKVRHPGGPGEGYTSPEAAREACDRYLRARGWVLL